MSSKERRIRGRPRVFVSYRRADSGGYAGQLFDSLAAHYGTATLFLDHQIAPGRDWRAELDAALRNTDVLLVVIGPDWTSVEQAGVRRLDDPDDWVRREVEAGLASEHVTVIPVLVGEVAMPKPEDLPESMRPLLDRQCFEVRPDRYRSDVTALIRAVGGWRSRLYGVPVVVWPAIAIVVALIVVLAVGLLTRRENRPPEIAAELTTDATSGGEPVVLDLLQGASDDTGPVALADVDPLSSEKGTVEIVEGGSVEYTPPEDFHGVDTFRYRVVDEEGARAEGIVRVQVVLGPMRSDFNVAVASFDAGGAVTEPDVADRVDDLSDSVYDQIAAELDRLNESGSFDFEVRAPEDTGPVSGADPAERARDARRVGAAIDADVVVYGVVDEDGVRPAFFVLPRGRNLTNAEELAGDYDLGARVLGSPLAAGSITANAELRDALAARARALTQFVIGLSWYADHAYDRAVDAFEAADVAEWEDRDGKEIVHLFVGNAAGKLGDVDRADLSYDRALALNPDFARALLGRAEVEFFRAAIVDRDGCAVGDVDLQGLQQSADWYEAALDARDRPDVSNIGAKSDFGIGRIELCRTLAGASDRAEAADRAFGRVVAEFEAGNESIGELASESLANQALLVLVDDAGRGEPASLARAIELYDRAIELATDDTRRQVLVANRCDVAGVLGEDAGGCEG